MSFKFKRIFVCGIHGVGKSTYIEKSKKLGEYSIYVCSDLIKKYSGLQFNEKKIINAIENQDILLKAVNYFVYEEFVLFDGHIILFNKNNDIDIVDISVLKDLNIEYIIFLKANHQVIYERLIKRDGGTWLTPNLIDQAQKIEMEKVIEYSQTMGISYEVIEWDDLADEWKVSLINL
ncbi:MAG: AAA family ATPase [Tissierellia bacterium]|nr:AAA family ATPase [Tissierellia bacterium]MDD4727052.1 AAA family ATPase [Tissierellia bacterium]